MKMIVKEGYTKDGNEIISVMTIPDERSSAKLSGFQGTFANESWDKTLHYLNSIFNNYRVSSVFVARGSYTLYDEMTGYFGKNIWNTDTGEFKSKR